MANFRTKFWNSGLIIAFFCIFENCLKVSLSATELVLGLFRNAMPNGTRVNTHSTFFVIFGALGIVCSILLFVGLSKKTAGCILSWLSFQKISIVISIVQTTYFSSDLLKIQHTIVFLILLSYTLLQLYFTILIYRIYHCIVETDYVPTTAAPLNVPMIGEFLNDQPPAYDTLCKGFQLLTDQAVMVEMEPPAYDTLHRGAELLADQAVLSELKAPAYDTLIM